MTISIHRLSDSICREELAQIAIHDPTSIHAAVARVASHKTYAHVASFFEDLGCHGCVSGMIPGLVSYADTHLFFDVYYDEIDALRQEFEDNTGAPLKIDGDLKNGLAWFAFEQTALCVAQALELEL